MFIHNVHEMNMMTHPKPDTMDERSYRELKVLEELSANSSATQRQLAKKLDLALGLTNLMIRRLVNKGWVKVTSLQHKRIRYLLTPSGIAEKARLSCEYLEYSLYLYRRVRELLKNYLQTLSKAGGRNIVLYGTGELAEIGYLTLKEVGLNLVSVVDDAMVGRTFLGLPIITTHQLKQQTFDCVLIGTLDPQHERLLHLKTMGIPEEKIFMMEQRDSQIQTIAYEHASASS